MSGFESSVKTPVHPLAAQLIIQGPYYQHLIFFGRQGYAEQARALVFVQPFQVSVMYHSNLLGPFIRSEESEAL